MPDRPRHDERATQRVVAAGGSGWPGEQASHWARARVRTTDSLTRRGAAAVSGDCVPNPSSAPRRRRPTDFVVTTDKHSIRHPSVHHTSPPIGFACILLVLLPSRQLASPLDPEQWLPPFHAISSSSPSSRRERRVLPTVCSGDLSAPQCQNIALRRMDTRS